VNSEHICLIDGIAAFFSGSNSGKRNWSKIPFSCFDQAMASGQFNGHAVQDRFALFARQASALGFNAISLDDIAHLVSFPFYPEHLAAMIQNYQSLFRNLFSIARSNNLNIFITTDILFFNSAIETHIKNGDTNIIGLLQASLRQLFEHFPEVSGVIVRVGESDGMDVTGIFHSRLIIKSPQQCRQYLENLLPIVEQHQKQLIVRTWSLGAYRIGDLMWNPETYQKVFGDLRSDHLIVSHKYGTGDFFRYLDLNPLFFEGPQKKIIELQARREYEGFGVFPSYIGDYYAELLKKAQSHKDIAGIYVWCQTGGWSHYDNLTFLENSSLWNEINTYVIIRIFKEGISPDDAVKYFCEEHLPGRDPELVLKLLKLSDRVIREAWYLPEFSQKQLYFRRVRVPPLLWILWDTILINHTLRKVLRRMIGNRMEAVRQGYAALRLIQEMTELARTLHIPHEPFIFQYDTFKLLALAREYFLTKKVWHTIGEIERAVRQYRQKYPEGFIVEYNFSPLSIKKILIKFLLKVWLRQQPQYRHVDRLFLNLFTSWLYPFFRLLEKRRFPGMTQSQAMGLRVFFK
jgi:hypothetical protein